MLISRKPYCNWCENRCSEAYGPSDYQLYICDVEEFAKRFPERVKDGFFMVKEKMRCPDKKYFKPIYTIEQVRKHNNHK